MDRLRELVWRYETFFRSPFPSMVSRGIADGLYSGKVSVRGSKLRWLAHGPMRSGRKWYRQKGQSTICSTINHGSKAG